MTEEMLILLPHTYQQRHSGVRGQATPVCRDFVRHLYERVSVFLSLLSCYAHTVPPRYSDQTKLALQYRYNVIIVQSRALGIVYAIRSRRLSALDEGFYSFDLVALPRACLAAR
jgi:hypothetical protein